MRKAPAEITKRLVAAVLVTAAVVGVSAIAIHPPTQGRSTLARPLKSIQTDKATLFYADCRPNGPNVVERTEQSGLSENLKLVAAAF